MRRSPVNSTGFFRGSKGTSQGPHGPLPLPGILPSPSLIQPTAPTCPLSVPLSTPHLHTVLFGTAGNFFIQHTSDGVCRVLHMLPQCHRFLQGETWSPRDGAQGSQVQSVRAAWSHGTYSWLSCVSVPSTPGCSSCRPGHVQPVSLGTHGLGSPAPQEVHPSLSMGLDVPAPAAVPLLCQLPFLP